jgi:outer membrane protein assembly factor BamB
MFSATRSTFALLLISGLAHAGDWLDYRGPTRDGKSPAGDVPLTWSETENVTWKTPIHGSGLSSPIVLGDQVWLTTATPDGKDMFVICVDRNSGKVLLDKTIFHNERPRTLNNNVNSYATPSPVAEPGRVYVHFGSYGTACLDTKTFDVLWQRRDLPCDHWRGPGSSPALHGNNLVLTFDGANVQYVAALDTKTGDTRWVTFRSGEFGDLGEDGRPGAGGDTRKSYATATIVEHDGRFQVVSPAAKGTYCYDLDTGKEIWRVRHPSQASGARTVFSGDLVITFSGIDPTESVAIRLGGKGDVTDTHIAWRTKRGVPARSSPILLGNRLYMGTETGVATCLDISTREPVWQERLGNRLTASMVHAVGRIYLFDEAGNTHVIQTGEKFRLLAKNKLNGSFMASPAIAGQAFYLRTDTHLYRIGKKQS